MTATPGTSSITGRSPSLLTTVLNVVNPLAGNTPGVPAGVDSPFALIFAGAARREVGVESFTSQALLDPSSTSLTYDPTIGLVHGVITGTNTPTSGLTYLVVSQPDGGGKVYVDPVTGDFAYLPDLSSVQDPGNTETFKVVVAETTPFTSALTGVPLVGALASQVLVVLYQIPAVNVVLSPIIGRSEITDVPIAVSTYNPGGTPIAFTVKIASPKDGTPISTNYFPSWDVAAGKAATAPTILNGPGLASAGNIDPTAPNTVDGLVPGIDDLTAAGYNVVTGIRAASLTPEARFSWTRPRTRARTSSASSIGFPRPRIRRTPTRCSIPQPATPVANDPAIGMVGGSYGGGIQLVTAGLDKRVDVIVPGIAWNNLEDSLYTRQAFKTSYSSLLLLGLVTTGSRINPQIYGGIITGAVLGILFPGQQALLNASGPDFLVPGISAPDVVHSRHGRCAVPAPAGTRERRGIAGLHRSQDDLVLRRTR